MRVGKWVARYLSKKRAAFTTARPFSQLHFAEASIILIGALLACPHVSDQVQPIVVPRAALLLQVCNISLHAKIRLSWYPKVRDAVFSGNTVLAGIRGARSLDLHHHQCIRESVEYTGLHPLPPIVFSFPVVSTTCRRTTPTLCAVSTG